MLRNGEQNESTIHKWALEKFFKEHYHIAKENWKDKHFLVFLTEK